MVALSKDGYLQDLAAGRVDVTTLALALDPVSSAATKAHHQDQASCVEDSEVGVAGSTVGVAGSTVGVAGSTVAPEVVGASVVAEVASIEVGMVVVAGSVVHEAVVLLDQLPRAHRLVLVVGEEVGLVGTVVALPTVPGLHMVGTNSKTAIVEVEEEEATDPAQAGATQSLSHQGVGTSLTSKAKITEATPTPDATTTLASDKATTTTTMTIAASAAIEQRSLQKHKV